MTASNLAVPIGEDIFGIEIGFEKNSPAPSRVFRAMCGLIEALELVDADLISTITPGIRPILLLEDVEAGSVRAWLKNALISVDDQALKSGDL